MNLIVKLKVSTSHEKVKPEKGISFFNMDSCNQDLPKTSEFCGIQISIIPKTDAEFEKQTDLYMFKAMYANSYEVKKGENGNKLILNVGKKEEQIDGYIIFIESEIKTDGQILVENKTSNVVLLKEGNHLKFNLGEKKETEIKMYQAKLYTLVPDLYM